MFGLGLNATLNSYGHVETVSSSNLTFSWTSLTTRLTSEYFVHILSLVSNR